MYRPLLAQAASVMCVGLCAEEEASGRSEMYGDVESALGFETAAASV
jgi:hypothetical protein